MVPILLVSIGSFLGTVGVLVAYDPSPFCDFRDVSHPESALDSRSRCRWRLAGLVCAVLGAATVVAALFV
ncbi:hypothetical protein GJR96_11310 [Haloferax sp. MBLA0076]|uniref:Uncharacterized protein n=1 Tax=Haloferax litoreum TaxID=2666140 RepID=A0A6A8GH82_9EURY|nr:MULTISPECIES: hypothetical protein [Haloferax]KAB1193991.1 hypothetical protein Hfx1148_11265 [Haloferax sp. CBA1148]MRX22538.1 hypothetical protein [Haloferax litoreum]